MKIRRVRYEMFYSTNIFTTATTSGKYHQVYNKWSTAEIVVYGGTNY